MKKLFTMLVLALGLASSANAQISVGETTSKVIRTGNRAQAGNFGIYLGATSDIFENLGSSSGNFSAIPLINVKYMASDNLEYRLGLEWYDKSFTQENDDYEISNGESKFMFYPGVAYHFSPKNLLDVYAGAELPIGFGSMSAEMDDESVSASTFRIGAGAFIGLQAFVGNLPLAVGVEYGLSTIYNSVSDGTMKKDGYYLNGIESIQENVSNSEWKLGSQVRVTLSYYFSL